MNLHTPAAALAAAVLSTVASDQLEALLVALITLGVRELIYWLRNRRKNP